SSRTERANRSNGSSATPAATSGWTPRRRRHTGWWGGSSGTWTSWKGESGPPRAYRPVTLRRENCAALRRLDLHDRHERKTDVTQWDARRPDFPRRPRITAHVAGRCHDAGSTQPPGGSRDAAPPGRPGRRMAALLALAPPDRRNRRAQPLCAPARLRELRARRPGPG